MEDQALLGPPKIEKKTTVPWPFISALVLVSGLAAWFSVRSTVSNPGAAVSVGNLVEQYDVAAHTDSYRQFSTADPQSVSEAGALLRMLHQVSDMSGFLFGHEESNFQGQHWRYLDGPYDQSDVLNSTGSYPALFGFDFEQLLVKGFSYVEHVKYAYQQGAIIEFYWEAWNPVNGQDENNITGNPCKELLPGGLGNAQWTEWLGQIAEEVVQYEVNGTKIPIIFRLFHENTGGWYWWGTDSCSDEDYKAAYNYTVNYFYDTANIHQFIWLYAPSKPSQYFESAFSDRYPGDDLVDVIGFDRYAYIDTYSDYVLEDCRAVVNFSLAHNKVPVLAETGLLTGVQDTSDAWQKDDPHTDFFNNDFINFMDDDQGLCQKIAYALTWTNSASDYYWVPMQGQKTWSSFNDFHASNVSLFADDSRMMQMRQSFGYATGRGIPDQSVSTKKSEN